MAGRGSNPPRRPLLRGLARVAQPGRAAIQTALLQPALLSHFVRSGKAGRQGNGETRAVAQAAARIPQNQSSL